MDIISLVLSSFSSSTIGVQRESNNFRIFSYDQDRFTCKNGIFSVEYPLPENMSPVTFIENMTKNKKDVYIFFVNMYHTKLLETLE